MYQQPLHDLSLSRPSIITVSYGQCGGSTLAPSLLRRLADPRQGAPACIALLSRAAAQRGPGWAALTLPGLLDWLAQPCVAAWADAAPARRHGGLTVAGQAGGSRVHVTAAADGKPCGRPCSEPAAGRGPADVAMPLGAAVATPRNGNGSSDVTGEAVTLGAIFWEDGADGLEDAGGGGGAEGSAAAVGAPHVLEVRSRLLGFPPQLRPQLRQLLAALPRCAILYDSLDKRSRAVLRQLLAELGVTHVGGQADPWVVRPARGASLRVGAGAGVGAGTKTSADGLSPGGGPAAPAAAATGCPLSAGCPGAQGSRWAVRPPGGAATSSSLGAARGWVAAAMRASRLRYQRAPAESSAGKDAPPSAVQAAAAAAAQLGQSAGQRAAAGADGSGRCGSSGRARADAVALSAVDLRALRAGAAAGATGTAGAAAAGCAAFSCAAARAGGGGDGGNAAAEAGAGVEEEVMAGRDSWWCIPEEEEEEEEEELCDGDDEGLDDAAPVGGGQKRPRGAVGPMAGAAAASPAAEGGAAPGRDSEEEPAAETCQETAAVGVGGRNGRLASEKTEGVEVGEAAPRSPAARRAADTTPPAGRDAQGAAILANAALSPRPTKRPRALHTAPDAAAPARGQAAAAGDGPAAEAVGGAWADVLKQLQEAAARGGSHAEATLSWRHIETLLEQCAAASSDVHQAIAAAAAAPAPPLPPDAVSYTVRHVVTPRLSGAAARLVLGGVVLPAVVAVERVMPKPLQEAMAAAAGPHPRPLAEAVLVPAARRSGLTAGQAQLLVKVAAAGPAALPRPLQALVLCSAAGAGAEWSEAHVAVVQGLVEAAKDDMDLGTLTAVAHGLCAAAASRRLAGSVPLCRLLLLLLSRHGGGLGPSLLRQLQGAAGATACFMTRPCLAKLQELLAASAGS